MSGSKKVNLADPHYSQGRLIVWACLLGAPYHLQYGTPIDVLPMPSPNSEHAKELLDGLKRDWHVETRENLVQNLNWLGLDGHRRDHAVSVRRYSLLLRHELAGRRELMRGDALKGNEMAAKEIYRLDLVQADGDQIRAGKFLAFDAARACRLVFSGRVLGWLDEDEARDYLADLARDTHQTYASWADYADDLLRGRNYWFGDVLTGDITDMIKWLRDSPKSPWKKLPWNIPEFGEPRPIRALREGSPWRSLENPDEE